MKKLFAIGAALLLAGGAFAADPLPTTIAGLKTNIGDRLVPFDDSAPVLDGTVDANEYTYSSGLIVSNGVTTTSDGSDGPGDISGTEPPTSAADLSYTLYMSHDANNVYLAVDIVDDVLMNASTVANNSWRNDAVELYIDADNTADGRFGAGNNDRGSVAGGRVDFASSVEGDENTADVRLAGNGGVNNYGPSFTLPDSSYGRFNTVSYGVNNTDSTPGAANPLTDLDFIMHRISPTTNGNRVLEVRIPKTGLSYNRTANPTTGAPAAGTGTFTNSVFGLRVQVDDDDLGVVAPATNSSSQSVLHNENAGENLDGTDSIWNATGAGSVLLNSFVSGTTIYFDATNGGIFDGFTWVFEASCPRFELQASAQPTAVKAWDYR